jgi:hypothetical protein
MEQQQLQDFNERLSQWISNQGFWFQVRYSMAGSGVKGRLLFHFLKICFRLLIFLLLVIAVAWVLLMKRTDSPRFIEAQQALLQEGFSAADLDVRGYRRSQGRLEISRLAAVGGDQTFFSNLEINNLRCNMGIIDGLVGTWDPGLISIARLDVDLRAGADDEASSANIAAGLFRSSGKVDINTLEIASANIRWGFSQRTQGSITNSTMLAFRQGDGWKVILKGGTFNQNWLQNLEIVQIEAVCDRDTLVFNKAELRSNDGTVDFSGLRISGGARPMVTGLTKVRHLNLETVLPPALHSFVEGSLSGDFKTTGSTNSSDGIGFEGQVTLDGKDTISLRERIHLLKALSIVDYSRNYHRVDFREGSFLLKTTNGGLEATDVNLKADDQFTLQGQLRVRVPTETERQAAIAKGGGLDSSPIFAGDDAAKIERKIPKSESDLTLKRAAQEAQRIKEGTQSVESVALFDKISVNSELRRLEQMEMDRLSRMLRYEGMFSITIPGNAFERAPKLRELYPADPVNGRVVMRVPVEGDIYEITLKQAEDTYVQGQR